MNDTVDVKVKATDDDRLTVTVTGTPAQLAEVFDLEFQEDLMDALRDSGALSKAR